MARLRRLLPILSAVSILVLVISACSQPIGSDPKVQMVPDPTAGSNTYFTGGFDDDYANVAFTRGFTFSFFGTTYNSVWINTNGGVTFGAGDSTYAPLSTDMVNPGIAPLWADLDAGVTAPTNPDGIDYQQFDDRFVITYTEYGDHVDNTHFDTMTLTLYANGKVVFHYNSQQTVDDVLVGIFDGSGTYPSRALQTTYNGYSSGAGFYMFNGNDAGGTNPTLGQLDGMTLTFNP
ncbi:MAG TPA: hypothetical protein VKA00_04030 [Trueperaceae bacterium]|nr:hypothetical protein [Trueperaceae bacterium]